MVFRFDMKDEYKKMQECGIHDCLLDDVANTRSPQSSSS